MEVDQMRMTTMLLRTIALFALAGCIETADAADEEIADETAAAFYGTDPTPHGRLLFTLPVVQCKPHTSATFMWRCPPEHVR
jgi:hypothetical protein